MRGRDRNSEGEQEVYSESQKMRGGRWGERTDRKREKRDRQASKG